MHSSDYKSYNEYLRHQITKLPSFSSVNTPFAKLVSCPFKELNPSNHAIEF